MKSSLFPFYTFLLMVILALHVKSDERPSNSYSQKPAGREIIGCAPGSLDEFYVNNEGKFITPLRPLAQVFRFSGSLVTL